MSFSEVEKRKKSDINWEQQTSEDEIQIDHDITMGEGPSQMYSVEKSRQEQAEMERQNERLVSMIDQKDFYGLDDFFEKQKKYRMTDIRDPNGYSMLHLACYKNIESVAFYLIRKIKDTEGTQKLQQYIRSKTKGEEF